MLAFAAPPSPGYRDRVRIWSLHPAQLDRQGLLACWRETLLAQAVLLGRTRGYTRHPQLERFRALPDPVGAVGRYLVDLAAEAAARLAACDGPRPHPMVDVVPGPVEPWERAALRG